MNKREPTALYTDGGVCGVNGLSEVGTYAWVITDQHGRLLERSYGLVWPMTGVPVVTNNTAELYALIAGLRALPWDWCGPVYCDSQIALGRTFLRLEKRGVMQYFRKYAMNGVPDVLARAIAPTVARLGAVRPVLLDGLHLNGPGWGRRWDEDPDATALAIGDGVGKRGGPTKAWNGYCDYLCNKAKRELAEDVNARMPRRELREEDKIAVRL